MGKYENRLDELKNRGKAVEEPEDVKEEEKVEEELQGKQCMKIFTFGKKHKRLQLQGMKRYKNSIKKWKKK